MGILFSAAEVYARGSFWAAAEPLTAMLWFYGVDVPTVPGSYKDVGPYQADAQGMSLFHSGGSAKFSIGTNTHDFIGTTPIVNNTWYHAAWTRSGSSHIGYLNGVQECSGTDAEPVGTTLQIGYFLTSPIGVSSFGFDGRYAAIKLWNAALTAAEILQEMRQIQVFRTQNLLGFYPALSLSDDEIDYSGHAQTLTVTGSPAAAPGPPVPWRQARRQTFVVAGAASDPALLLQLDTDCMSAGRY